MKKIKQIGSGTILSTALLLLLLAFFLAIDFLAPGWWQYDDFILFEVAAFLGGLVPSVYFAIKKMWWALLGTTLGYIIALFVLSMLVEVLSGPAGF